MIITPLGHTELLVDIENSEGRSVRILVDSWLSDYAIGDMMERTVKVRLDPEKCNTIDAIYISHAHCDHFDPYTLREIYTYANPLLILPFTLRYLEGLICGYLPRAEVKWLENGEAYVLHGIEITGHIWPHQTITNEDDVMMLSIASDREFLFAEIDTVPDGESLEVQRSLYQLFTARDYETMCYVASRNELEGYIGALDAPDERYLIRSKSEYLAIRKEEIEWGYAKWEYDEYSEMPNIFSLPGFVRAFVGQGMSYPRSLSESLADMSIFPLDQVADMESNLAKNHDFTFLQKALLPGRQYRVDHASIEPGRKECPIGTLENRGQRTDDRSGKISQSRIYASGPLFPRELSESDILEAKGKILDILNHRFLLYWSASSVASLRDALIKNNGIYRVSCSVISSEDDSRSREILPREEQDFSPQGGYGLSLLSKGQVQSNTVLFEYSTARSGFIEVPHEENMHIDEDYFLLDILDFLEGRQEMYSSFWHRLDPKRAYRLWTGLGANFCNNDLVEKKYRLHFDRARNSGTANEFVEGTLQHLHHHR